MFFNRVLLNPNNLNPYYDASYNEMNDTELSDRKGWIMNALFYSTMIRAFTLIDGVFLLFWALFYWPFLFPLFLCVCGYYGAKHYRPELLTLYAVYVVAEIALRVYWLVKPVDSKAYFIVVTAIGLAICAYILYACISLIYYISKLNFTELTMLRDLNTLWYSDCVVIVNSYPHYNLNNPPGATPPYHKEKRSSVASTASNDSRNDNDPAQNI